MCYSGTLCLKTGLWVHICNDRKENIAKLLGKHDLAKYIRIVSMYLLLLTNKGFDPPPQKKKILCHYRNTVNICNSEAAYRCQGHDNNFCFTYYVL
jgi:hypothetical protein